LRTLEQVALTVDEFEAIRLADLEGLYQEEALAANLRPHTQLGPRQGGRRPGQRQIPLD